MRTLLEYVRSREVCLALADRLSDNPMVQGIHFEPSPDLLEEWLEERYIEPDGDVPLDVPADPQFDFKQMEQRLGRVPLLARIHLCPERAGEGATEARRSAANVAEDFRSQLSIVLEDRAPTVAAVAAGDYVVESRPGTVGGFLMDGVERFGVTCAHVAQLGQNARDSAGSVIGTVVEASLLSPSPANTPCGRNAQGANVMDAALIHLTGASMPLASGVSVSANYGSGQRAMMRGAKSGGPNSYYFGSIGLTHIVSVPRPGGSQLHCFHNLSSIRPRRGRLRSFLLGFGRGHRALRGDSGAFITDVGGSLWYGMLTAVDGTEGFFVDATDVLDWARNAAQRPGLNPY